MKQTLIIAIAMASITAFAQTETTTPAAATTTEAAPAVAAPAKKAVKKAKKKKAAKPSAQAPAATAPAAKTETVAPATTAAPAASMTAPAAGTSTATAAAPAAATKKWSASAAVLSTNDYLTQGDIQTLSTVGGSYKVTDKLSVKVKQTFETLTAGPDLNTDTQKRDRIDSNNFRAAYSDMNISYKLPGILGSNELPISLNYKDMNGDAVYVTPGLGAYGTAHALVEANLSIPYTLSPKWEVSIDTQIRHVVRREGASQNTHRVLAIPSVSYSVNDFVSIYQAAGAIFSFDRNERLRNTYQRAYLATGVSVVPTKGLTLDLNVSQDKAVSVTSDKPEAVTGFNLYSPTLANGGTSATFDAVAYEGSITYVY